MKRCLRLVARCLLPAILTLGALGCDGASVLRLGVGDSRAALLAKLTRQFPAATLESEYVVRKFQNFDRVRLFPLSTERRVLLVSFDAPDRIIEPRSTTAYGVLEEIDGLARIGERYEATGSAVPQGAREFYVKGSPLPDVFHWCTMSTIFVRRVPGGKVYGLQPGQRCYFVCTVDKEGVIDRMWLLELGACGVVIRPDGTFDLQRETSTDPKDVRR